MPLADAAPLLRTGLRSAAIHALSATGGLRHARNRLLRTPGILVLMLHRIVADAQLPLCRSPRGMVLRESLFAQLLDYLAAHTQLVAPHEVCLASASLSERPRVLLTFDDGWLDNATIALPHLNRVHARACFFVVTGLVGQRHPFWPEQALHLLATACARQQLPQLAHSLAQLKHSSSPPTPPSLHSPDAPQALLTWLKHLPPSTIRAWFTAAAAALSPSKVSDLTERQENPREDPPEDPDEALMPWSTLRALQAEGHRIGSHTLTHALLPQLAPQTLQQELVQSRLDLQQHLPSSPANLWLSYPNGSVSPTVTTAAAQSGYQYGFATTPALWQPASHPYLVPRLNVWDGILTDRQDRFSPAHLEHALFWRTRHAPPPPPSR